jgi:DNA-formamidopyrimidine glycosylase
MPEGPELKHSRDVLRNIVVGKSIVSMSPTQSGRYAKKNPDGFEDIVNDLPLNIEAVDVKGKFMWWTLKGSDKTWYLWSTYGMSGQWSRSPGKHTAFVVEYVGGHLYFNDQRRFGTIKFVHRQNEHDKKLKSLGPDVLEDPPMLPELFAERILVKPSRTIAEALMDQSCVSGIGNYLKAEVLHRARVSPHRVVTDLTSEEIQELWAEAILSCRESYSDHGASIRTYRTVEDNKGKAQFYFRVYNQKKCALGHDVHREETADGRTSWWCQTCQK